MIGSHASTVDSCNKRGGVGRRRDACGRASAQGRGAESTHRGPHRPFRSELPLGHARPRNRRVGLALRQASRTDALGVRGARGQDLRCGRAVFLLLRPGGPASDRPIAVRTARCGGDAALGATAHCRRSSRCRCRPEAKGDSGSRLASPIPTSGKCSSTWDPPARSSRSRCWTSRRTEAATSSMTRRRNVGLPESLFSFDIPEGVEVIQG